MFAPSLECVSNQDQTWECHSFELSSQDLCLCSGIDSTETELKRKKKRKENANYHLRTTWYKVCVCYDLNYLHGWNQALWILPDVSGARPAYI